MSKARNARRFLWDEDEENKVSTLRPMGNPRFNIAVDQSLNIAAMGDQPPGANRSSSLGNSIASIFLGSSTSLPKFDESNTEWDEYGDAAPSGESEEYIGGKRRRLNPVWASIRAYLDPAWSSVRSFWNKYQTKDKIRATGILFSCIVTVFGVWAIFHSKQGTRTKEIRTVIVNSNVTPQSVFRATRTNPQQLALDWIVNEDGAKLSADHPALLERYTLAVFFFSSNGNEWKTSDNWMSSKGHCSWYGIQCVARDNDEEESGISKTYDDNDHITAIVMTKNGMEGTIPPEFQSLSNTQTIDMSENTISGSLPEFHPSLKYLLLKQNALAGSIPESISELKNLHGLDLSKNRFKGTLPESFRQLQELRYLLLSGNVLVGKFPDVSNFSKLSKLHLDDNSLSGSLPTYIESFTRLTEFRIGKNKFEGPFPADTLEKLTTLEVLDLGDNSFTGTLPNIFDHIHRLTELHLNNNNLKGSIPESLGHLSGMKTLRLENNQLSGTIPANLSVMRDIEKVALNNNNFKGTIPTNIGYLDDISYLSLKNNQLTGTIPTELGNCFRMSDLHLHNNQLTGSIPTELGTINGLAKLSLERNKFSGVKVPSQICALTNNDLSSLSADCNDPIIVSCDCCDKCF